MRIIITRHGQTEENKEGILQGHLPGRLSELGKEQARKLALRLKNEKIDIIYSSDLARAADTAKEVAKYHPKTQVKFVEEMREKHLGEYQGIRKADMGWDPKEMKGVTLEAKDGESTKEMYERAGKFIDFLKKKHPKGTVLLVGHNGINIAIVGVLMGKKCEELATIEKMKNTSVNTFEANENGKFTVKTFNCTKHCE